ncbi:MAG: hypothetical protein Q9188_001785 [Gyalolechia gomerana]
MMPLRGRQQYRDLVYDISLIWTEAIQRLPPEEHPPEDLSLLESWKIMIEDAMPELVNVVDGEALWRIPYCDRTDVWGTYLAEAVSTLMEVLEGERWLCFAVGVGRNVGDVFNKGPLSRQEIAQIQRGSFPRSLELYGVPGPGVCEPQHQAGSGRAKGSRPSRGAPDPHDDYAHDYDRNPPRQSRQPGQQRPPRHQRGPQHGPRPPRQPQPPRGQRGPPPLPGPSARGHYPPTGADSPSSLSSGTDTTSNSSISEDAGRGRRRGTQQALTLGVAALGLGDEDGDDQPSRHGARGGPPARGPPARGPGRRGPPPGREGGERPPRRR